MQVKTEDFNVKQNTEQIEKNISLLREFNLEEAKNGAILCDNRGYNNYKFLGYSKVENRVAVQSIMKTDKDFIYSDCSPEDFKMTPLAWVEGKPVYQGDILYSKNFGDLKYVVKYFNGKHIFTEENETDAFCNSLENLTWNKPKQKKSKKVWVNIYPTGPGDRNHPSQEKANEAAMFDCIGQVEVEINWEEQR